MAHDPPGTTYKIIKEGTGAEFLRNKLKLKSFEAKKSLSQKYPHVEKFFADRGIDLAKIREHSAKVITTGALTGTLLFAPPTAAKNLPQITEMVKNVTDFKNTGTSVPQQKILLDSIHGVLPQKVGPLTR